jgi:hypothetical protein
MIAEVWAVDQEPDTIEVVRVKAATMPWTGGQSWQRALAAALARWKAALGAAQRIPLAGKKRGRAGPAPRCYPKPDSSWPEVTKTVSFACELARKRD